MIKKLWRSFKDWLIKMAIKGLVKWNPQKAKNKLIDILIELKEKYK